MAPLDSYVDPGAMLVSTHELDDGTAVRLRLTRPTDGPRVRRLLDELSPESRALRFLAPMPHVSDDIVRHFVFYDPRERMVVAAAAQIDGIEQIVGLADLVLIETGLAEIGLVVAEEQRGQGAGKLLSEAIAHLALRSGATHLKAEVADRNGPMIGLMRRLGQTVTTLEQGNSVVYTKLEPPAARSAA